MRIFRSRLDEPPRFRVVHRRAPICGHFARGHGEEAGNKCAETQEEGSSQTSAPQDY